jgi:hypothetical protein
MKNILRLGGGLVAAFAAVVAMTMMPSVGAVAATSTAASAVARAQPALPAAGNPQCPQGDFCTYTQKGLNGLCIASPVSVPDMGSCANTDEGVYNNGYVGTYDYVFMYWNYNYGGAYTCLPVGGYWAYTQNYEFNNSPGLQGYHQLIEKNVASFLWGTYNCGHLYVS